MKTDDVDVNDCCEGLEDTHESVAPVISIFQKQFNLHCKMLSYRVLQGLNI